MKIVAQAPIIPLGIGQADYSMTVDQSVQKLASRHQFRISPCGNGVAWTWPYVPGGPWAGWFYASPLYWYDMANNAVLEIPDDIIYMMYDYVITGDQDQPTLATLMEYASGADAMTFGAPEDFIFWKIGQRKSEVHITNGIKLKPGHAYLAGWMQWFAPLWTPFRIMLQTGILEDRLAK